MNNIIEIASNLAQEWHRGQAFDLTTAVKEACKVREGLTAPSEAITELDKKIAEADRRGDNGVILLSWPTPQPTAPRGRPTGAKIEG